MTTPLLTSLDAHKPAEITRLIRLAGVTKAELAFLPLLMLSLLGGAFISLGALFYTQTTAGYAELTGALKLMGGVTFSLGLILVVIGGAELFTGNTMIVMAYVDRKIGTLALLRNWTVVLIGNALGSIATLTLVLGAGLLEGTLGLRAADIAEAKVALSPQEAFFSRHSV